MVVAYTLIIQAVGVGTIYYCFALFTVPWISEFSQGRAEVMLAIALMQFCNGLISPMIGAAMDRFRVRNLVALGAVIYASGFIALSSITAFWQVYLIYGLVFPLALGLTGNLAAQVLITRRFQQDRGLALGISAMGTNLGGIVFPLLAADAIGAGAWRDVTLNFALVSLLVVVPLTFWVLRHRAVAPATTASQQASISARQIVTSRTFLICAIGFVFMNMAFNAVQTNVAVMANDLGIADWSGRLIALTAITMVLGKFFFGLVGDRVHHQRLFWLSSGTMLSGLLILLATPSPVQFAVGVGLIGLAGGGFLPIIGLIIGARYPLEYFGRVMGLMMLAWSTGAIGPVIAGAAYDATGGYGGALLLFAGLLVPGIVAMYWLPGTLREQENR